MVATTQLSRIALLGVAALVLATLPGCGKLSDVGDQETRAPHAVVTAIGYAGADASGDVSVDIRSQAEILLSGKDSVESDAPILSFLFEPQNDAARAAAVSVRNLNTINVTIPAVSAPTDLVFKLTTRESDGDSDTATATLHVFPALDTNRFLTAVADSARIRVRAATLQPVAGGGAFTLNLKARITYITRTGAPNTVDLDVAGGSIQGEWASSVGSGGDSATDFRNPIIEFRIPSFNADDVIRLFQSDLPASSSNLPDPAFVDQVGVQALISIDAPTLQTGTVLYALEADGDVVARADNGNTGVPTVLTLDADQVDALRISGGGFENKVTAAAYYDAIDPNHEKTTLNDWLVANCMSPAATNFAADAHAVYTNNFDLGFGRDMYFKTTKPASCTSTSFGAADAAAVVINYLSLEGAAKKLGPIIAVAMEYKASDASRSQPGLVTFYAFAPDDTTGAFLRVSSANFDGRGEKPLPGSCTACHGGRPLPPAADPHDTYALSSNVGATFMPWDLESLLYSDTDPAFPSDAPNASLRAQFTRALQEPEFKKLNAAAYSTFGSAEPFQCYPAFAGPCELVELWYGAGLTSATFRDRQIAPGWVRGGPDNNPVESEQIYLDVFARHCRACHVQRVQDPTGEIDPQFRTHAELVDPVQAALIKSLVFNQGTMPAARLTMDRFWSPGSAGNSPGDQLAAHLGVQAPAAPGRAVACQLGTFLSADNTNRTSVTRNSTVSQSGSCSQFAGTYSWTLTKPAGSAASLVGGTSVNSSFVPDKAGNYDLSLNVTSPNGLSQSSTSTFGVVPNLLPVAQTLTPASVFNVNTGIGTAVGADALALPNSQGDLPASVAFANPVNLAFTPGAGGLVTLTPTSLNNGSLAYTITDVDGDAAAGTVQLTVQPAGSLVAADDLAPAVNANSGPSAPINVLANDLPLGLSGVTITADPNGTCQGRLGTRASVVVNPDNTITYTPPKALVTSAGYDGPSDLSCKQADSFTYTMHRAGLADSTATVRVRVDGTAFFGADVNSILITAGRCIACHAAIGTPTGANWAIPTAYSNWRNNDPANDAVFATDDSDFTFLVANEVNTPGDTSLVLLKIVGGRGHTSVVTPTELAAIRKWIEEGAYNN